MSQNITIINDVKYKSMRDWVLSRAEALGGDFTIKTIKEFYYDPETGINYDEITYSSGLAKIFDEAITNATDNYRRNPYLRDPIEVDIATDHFRIKNYGATIPFDEEYIEDLHRSYRKPELTFSVFKTSSNYDDTQIRTTNGKNGVGIKLTNVFSKYFELNIVNGQWKYHQTFQYNMDENYTSTPDIVPNTNCERDSVEIIVYPDFPRLKIPGIIDGNFKHILFRTFSCVIFGHDIIINGQKVPGCTFIDFAKMLTRAYFKMTDEQINEKFEEYIFNSGDMKASSLVYVVPQRFHEQFSFVNNIYTSAKGTHIRKLLNDVRETVLAEAPPTKGKRKVAKVAKTKANTETKPKTSPTNFLLVFLDQTVENPDFDGQAKNGLTSTITTDFTPLGTQLRQSQSLRNYINGNTSGKTKGNGNVFYKKCQKANKAGTSERMKCTLFVTEGDSATGMVNKGFKQIGHDYYGVYTLRGKVINVQKATTDKVDANTIISNLFKELGLVRGQTYTSKKNLRYGRVVMVKDADVDGDAIMGLVYNAFYTYFKPLLLLGLDSDEGPFFYEFTTPAFQILLPKKKGQHFPDKLEFTTQKEFNKKWKECVEQKLIDPNDDDATHYMKGLGAIADEDVARYFSDIDSHLIPITVHDEILPCLKQTKIIQDKIEASRTEQLVQIKNRIQELNKYLGISQNVIQNQGIQQQNVNVNGNINQPELIQNINQNGIQNQNMNQQQNQQLSQEQQNQLIQELQQQQQLLNFYSSNPDKIPLPEYIVVNDKYYQIVKESLDEYLQKSDSNLETFKQYGNIIYGALKADNYMTMVYGKGKSNIEARKNWVMRCNPKKVLERADGMVELPITLFQHLSNVHFAVDDCSRSMINLIDGMKPVYRKIIYTLFSHPSTACKFQKVSGLTGSTMNFAKYPHGDGSLEETIFTMMRNWAGSNNIPLLKNCGGIGSRLDLGSGHAQARYVSTALSDIARLIYIKDDDPILTPTYEEGKKVEPEFYVPIIPISLINGSCGIGVGFSNFIPNHNPYDCINYIRQTLNVPENLDSLTIFPNNQIPIRPYYPECITNIQYANNDKGYMSYGTQEWIMPQFVKGDNFWKCELLPGRTGQHPLDYNPAFLKVSGIPIGINLYTKREEIKEFLNVKNGNTQSDKGSDDKKKKKKNKKSKIDESEEDETQKSEENEYKSIKETYWPKVIDIYSNSSDGSNVQYEHVEEIFKIDNSTGIPEGFEVLPMKKHLYTTNMYTFNENGQIIYNKTIYDIMNHFMKVRFEYYIKRKNHKLKELENDIIRIRNKMRFIKFKVEGLNIQNELFIVDKNNQGFDLSQFGKYLTINEKGNLQLDSRGIKKDLLNYIMNLFQFDKYYQDEKNKVYIRYTEKIGNYDYITKSVTTHNETIEEYERLKNEMNKRIEECKTVKNIHVKDMWLAELDKLEKALIEIDNEKAEIKTSNIGKKPEECEGSGKGRRGRKGRGKK